MTRQVTVDASVYQVGYLERLPLGTPYPAIVAHTARLLARLPYGSYCTHQQINYLE